MYQYDLLYVCLGKFYIDNLICQYILNPIGWLGIIISGLLFYGAYQDKKIAAARGGIRKFYSELFDAIEKMPEGRILSEDIVSVTATYRNYSNINCKIKVMVTKESTFVIFKIQYKDRWIKLGKKRFDDYMNGYQIVRKISSFFPDSDLSTRYGSYVIL